MPKVKFEEPGLDPTFKQRLKHQFIARSQEAASKKRSLWGLLPAAALVAVILIVAIPLLSSPTSQAEESLSAIDAALSRLEQNLAADVAFAQEAAPAGAQARQVDEQVTAYIEKLNQIILLQGLLIRRLEEAGRDTSNAREELDTAQAQLAIAEAKAKQPVDCLQTIANENPEVPVTGESCQAPMSEAKDSLGDVVGTLKTSVNSAKQAL